MFGRGLTIWSSTFFDCSKNEIQLRHSQYRFLINKQCNNGAVVAKSVEANLIDGVYTSQLIVTIGEEMINKTVKCLIHNDAVSEGSSTSTIVGQKSLMTTEISYLPPNNVHVESNDSSHITFAWDEVTNQCSSLQYIITAINCGVCPNTTAANNITCILSDISLHTNTTCLFAVQTEICGYLRGERSQITVQLDGKYYL